MVTRQYDWIMRGALQEIIELIESDQKMIIVPPHPTSDIDTNKFMIHGHNELFIQVSGHTHFDFPQQQLKLNSTDILILPAGHPHAERAQRENGDYMQMAALFYPDIIELHLAESENGEKPEVCYKEIFEPMHLRLLQETTNVYVNTERDHHHRHNRVLAKGLQLTLLGCMLDLIKHHKN